MYLNEIGTKEYFDQFVRNINQLLLDLFGTSAEQLNVQLDTTYDYKFATIIRNALAKEHLDFSEANKLRVDSLLRKILKEAKDIDFIELHIAFEPTERFLGVLKSWVYRNVNEKTLLDIRVDKKVIGGAVLIHGGTYTDLSLGTKLDSLINTNE